jgi:hypothetical protein
VFMLIIGVLGFHKSSCGLTDFLCGVGVRFARRKGHNTLSAYYPESAPRKLSFAGADVRGKTVAVLNQRQTIDCQISHSSNYQQGTGTRRGSQDVI